MDLRNVLVGQLVRIGRRRRHDRDVLSITAVRRLDAGDIDTGRPATSWQIFDIEGGRLALGTDISDGCGALLVHDIDRGTLA